MLVDTFKDDAIVFLLEPETRFAERVYFGTNCRNYSSLLRHSKNTRCSDDIQRQPSRRMNRVGIVQKQTLRLELLGQRESFTFTGIKSDVTQAFDLGEVLRFANMKPRPLRGQHFARNRVLGTSNDNFLEYRLGNYNLVKDRTEQLEFIKCGKVNKWTAIRDNQLG